MRNLTDYQLDQARIAAWRARDDQASVFIHLAECPGCRQRIPYRAKACPSCGSRPKTIQLLKTAPIKRSECRDGPRPCGAIRCVWHSWLKPGEERAGRRYDGRPPPTTLEPRWLEVPTPPSCELDLIERGETSAAVMGKAKNKTARRIEQEIKAATAKLRAAGVAIEELKP